MRSCYKLLVASHFGQSKRALIILSGLVETAEGFFHNATVVVGGDIVRLRLDGLVVIRQGRGELAEVPLRNPAIIGGEDIVLI